MRVCSPHKANHFVNLALRIRVKAPVRVAGGPKVHDLDADGACIEGGFTLPKALTCMPRATIFRNQPIGAWFCGIAYEVMATDAPPRQNLE